MTAMTEREAVTELNLLRERMAEISRGNAVSESYSFLDGYFVEALDMAISKVENSEPQRWTLCEDELPKTTKWRTAFTVTIECDTWTPKRRTLTAEWENTTVRGKSVSRWVWNNRLLPQGWKVVAWAPLPVPCLEG